MEKNRIVAKLILPVALVWMAGLLNAQSLEELRKKKQQTSDEIRYTNELLGKIDRSQKSTLGKLRLISSQIDQRNMLIGTMSSEVGILEEVISDNIQVVEMLTEDLGKIKVEYAQMIRFAWKNRNAYDKILFFLSAENVNQAFRRFIYVKQYTEIRRRQAVTMATIQNILLKKTYDLENQTETKKQIISEKEEESRMLAVQKRQQSAVAKNLQRQQAELKAKLTQQRRIEQQLEREIQRIIEEEARKTAKTGKTGFDLTPEQKLAGTNFEQNKRRIPWPVDKGIVVEKFGIHAHPVLSNITVNNNGISIATSEGAKARAVFSGEVSRVFGITGGNTAVILRHGQYLTVYSNLVEVNVRKGDKIAVRQNLGTIFTDAGDENKTILKFQIWKESQKLNPEEWLAR